MKSSRTEPVRHERRAHGAIHPSWVFRREAAIWKQDRPVAPNMVAVAREMADWLTRKRSFLPGVTEVERDSAIAWTNPYSYHASSIAAAISSVVNDAHAFANSSELMHPMEAEIVRIRLHNELVLYTARFCEAAIKQMLFCTDLPRRLYKRASLGQLLAIDCDACRKAGEPTHDISLLGALAHQYFLCPTLDGCVIDHLQLVGQRRNVEAAHSDALALNPRTAAASRSDLGKVLQEVGELFLHMVKHIAEIEERMLAENRLYLARWGRWPSHDEFMAVPARPPEAVIEAAKAAMNTSPADVAAASEPD